MWTCPECKREFANANQWHSCINYPVELHLAGKSQHIKSLYRKFEETVLSLGGIRIVSVKTRIGFQSRIVFAAVNSFSRNGLNCHLILRSKPENLRFFRIEGPISGCYVCHFQINKSEDIDNVMVSWLKEAYD